MIESTSVVKNDVPWSAIKLAIVCPMANEEKNVLAFVQAVLDRCAGFKKVTFFSILDKACRDNTLNLLNTLQKSRPELSVIYAPENKNVVEAYFRGYNEALKSDSDWILEIDAGGIRCLQQQNNLH